MDPSIPKKETSAVRLCRNKNAHSAVRPRQSQSQMPSQRHCFSGCAATKPCVSWAVRNNFRQFSFLPRTSPRKPLKTKNRSKTTPRGDGGWEWATCAALAKGPSRSANHESSKPQPKSNRPPASEPALFPAPVAPAPVAQLFDPGAAGGADWLEFPVELPDPAGAEFPAGCVCEAGACCPAGCCDPPAPPEEAGCAAGCWSSGFAPG